MIRLIHLCFAVLLLLITGTSLAQATTPTIEPAPCPFNRPSGFSIQCGYVTVPESRDPALAEDGRTIRLAVAVFQSYNTQSGRTPLLYLDGGPGGHTLNAVEYLAATFQPFLLHQPVIFFDQRGVGFSQALDCPTYTDLAYDLLDQDLELEEVMRLANDTLLTCRDDYIAEGVNLTAYTSAESAADVRDIIAALGYRQVDLLGVSYGTRLALTIMRDHPSIVRSAILDAVLPLQANPDSEFIRNTQAAFATLFDGCARDGACKLHYPDLEAVFYETVDRLNAAPEAISVFDFYTGEDRDVLMTGDMLIDGLFGLLYQTNEIPNLPRYIYEARDGDYSGFVNDVLYTIVDTDYFDEVLFMTVGCNEETVFDSPEAANPSELPPQLAVYLTVQTESIFDLCAAWGDSSASPIENEPVSSDIPTLITVGEYDPITPPVWAYLAAETLPNSYVYEYPGVGHAAFIGSECALDMMVAFLANPHSAPDSACIANMPPPLFAISEIIAVNNHPYTSDLLGFSSVVPENWYEIEPGVFSPYPTLEPVAIPVIAFRFPFTLDDYVQRIITAGFYGYDRLPPSTATVRAHGRDWRIYEVERPDQAVYANFAFFDGDRPYVIGVTATSDQEREFLYDALLIPAIQAFEAFDME